MIHSPMIRVSNKGSSAEEIRQMDWQYTLCRGMVTSGIAWMSV
jgi:hypothetical protein